MKKPFPISIDKELADWIIKYSEKFRNRSHLVEEAIKEYMKEVK